MKFKYNYLHQTLHQETETWTEITETFAGKFSSQGFKLTEGWITLSIKPHKIQAFLKQRKFNNYLEAFGPQEMRSYDNNKHSSFLKETAQYFKKDLPKEEEVIFTFEPQDEVEKVGNAWIKKGTHEK